MDIRLREIAANPAGTYFMLTDNSPVPEAFNTGKTRLFFINTDKGAVNTLVLFKKGEKKAFENIFGKRMRKHEKMGNFSIYNVLEALTSSDVAVMNLRKFEPVDKAGISGLSPNQTTPETKETEYVNIFNRNGLWTIKPKNIANNLSTEHYLNFANVGKGNISYFVIKSSQVDSLTSYGNQTLINVPLEIEDYPGIDPDMLLKDTFVDVYIFNNTFENANLNKIYGQYFNAGNMIEAKDINALTLLKESGFVKKITGSLIPNLKNEYDENISVDTLVNNSYAETGLICYINDNVLEDETLGGMPIINTTMSGYYTENGALGSVGTLLSYRGQVVTPFNVDLSEVTSNMIKDLSQEFLVKTTGEIFPDDKEYGNEVYSLFQNNIRTGDTLFFKDKDTNKIENTQVLGIEMVEVNLPNEDGNKERLAKSVITIDEITTSTVKLTYTSVPNATSYKISRRTEGTGLASDNVFVELATVSQVAQFEDINLVNNNKYVYLVEAYGEGYIKSHSIPKEITVGGLVTAATNNTTIVPTELPDEPKSALTWDKLLLRTSIPVNADYYVRQLDIVNYQIAKVLPTALKAYIPRQEQFINGTASRQREILDVMLEPGIVKGLKNFEGLRYFVDCFKSYVEAGYKYQYGQLTKELEKSNKFVRAIVNEPFVEDLENSVNPLFKDNPGGVFDIVKWLPLGGNPSYSTQFLSKPATGGENCFYFGSEVDLSGDEYILSGKISNLFVQKSYVWDILANTTGYIDNVAGIPFNPDQDERKAMEDFKWNPIIKTNKGYTLYGNKTGQKTPTSLSQIHNSELLAYIQESLEKMSRDETFKKGTYDEFLTTEVEYQSFMNDLALVKAIQPNPIVICSAVNNDAETLKQKIKVIHVEYYNVNAIEKVVFDLKIN